MSLPALDNLVRIGQLKPEPRNAKRSWLTGRWRFAACLPKKSSRWSEIEP